MAIISSSVRGVPVSHGVTVLQDVVADMCATIEAGGGEVISVSHATQSFTEGQPSWTVLVVYRQPVEF